MSRVALRSSKAFSQERITGGMMNKAIIRRLCQLEKRLGRSLPGKKKITMIIDARTDEQRIADYEQKVVAKKGGRPPYPGLTLEEELAFIRGESVTVYDPTTGRKMTLVCANPLFPWKGPQFPMEE